MNPTTARSELQPLISAPAKLVGGLAALAILASAVSFAGHASHRAVDLAHAAMNPAIVYVTLPRVEVFASRLAAGQATEVACVNPQSRT